MAKILIIGDLHLRAEMPYAEYFPDGRVAEKKKVLEFLTKLSDDCDSVVLLGDEFNARNNPSEVIREFTAFVESFGNKEIYILAGNHDLMSDGKSAIDYMTEVKKPNWHIITNTVETIGHLTFVPYFYRTQFNAKTNSDAKKKLMKTIPKGKILFAHLTISGMNFNGTTTDNLPEIVLDHAELESRFESIFAGHIHEPSTNGKVINVGSVFTAQIGEESRSVYTIEVDEKGKMESLKQIELPVSPLVKVEEAELKNPVKGAFYKIILTKKTSMAKLDGLKETLRKNGNSYVIVDQIIAARKKLPFDENMELTLDNLLKAYTKAKDIDLEKLLAGYNLIKS